MYCASVGAEEKWTQQKSRVEPNRITQHNEKLCYEFSFTFSKCMIFIIIIRRKEIIKVFFLSPLPFPPFHPCSLIQINNSSKNLHMLNELIENGMIDYWKKEWKLNYVPHYPYTELTTRPQELKYHQQQVQLVRQVNQDWRENRKKDSFISQTSIWKDSLDGLDLVAAL